MQIKEILGFKPSQEESSNEPNETVEKKTHGIVVEIEAIHSEPYVTGNSTMYTVKAIQESVAKWTKPYNIPVIKHHNDSDGDIIGRVIDAKIKDSVLVPGTKALVLTADIIESEAKEGVRTGLLQTVSIGGRTNDVRCSICGADMKNDPCYHTRGQVYEGQVCTWMINDVTPDEVSYVIVPSDKNAKNIKIHYDDSAGTKVSENAENVKEAQTELPDFIKGEEEVSISESQKEETEANMEKETQTPEEVKTIPEQVEVKESETPAVEEPSVASEEIKLKESYEDLLQKVNAISMELISLRQSLSQEVSAVKEQADSLKESLATTDKKFEEFKTSSKSELEEAVTTVKESLTQKIKNTELSKQEVPNPVVEKQPETQKQEDVKLQEQLKPLSDFSRYFRK